MSERRKKDRYNETWTKDELTDSLKRIDKKSSHRSDSGRHREKQSDDYYEKKERRRKEEKEQSSHKSRSKRRDSPDGNYDSTERERKRDHHSRKEEESRHRNDGRSRRHDKDDPYVNGDDRHHSKRERHREDDRHQDESNHRADKKTSRDLRHRNGDESSIKKNKKYEDDYDSNRHRKHEDERPHRREKRREDDRDSRNDSHRRHKDRDDKGRRVKDDLYEQDRRNKRRGDEHHERKDRRREEEHYDRETKGSDHSRWRHHDRNERDDEDEKRRLRRERRHKEKESESDHRKSKDRESEKHSRNDKHRKSNRRSDRHSQKYSEDDTDSKSSEPRDKRGERRHHKESRYDKLDGGGSASSKSKSSDKKSTEDKDEDDYNYDDDEFEDYADDFEDEDDEGEKPPGKPAVAHGEMDELMRAIAAENERANSAQSSGRLRSTVTSDRNESPYSVRSSNSESNRSSANEAHMTMINFSAARKSSASSRVKKRMMKRSNDLLNLIQLDSVSFDILEMAPVTEYNLYIKNYGNSNTTQASVQCNDDSMDQDIQTEIPDVEDKWSQHPPHDNKCSGGDKVSVEDTDNSDRERLLATMRGSSMHLTRFMSRASKLIESIINNDEMWEISIKDNKERSKLSFCEGYVPLQTNLAYLQGRKAVHITSSQGSSQNLIAVAFEPASTSFSTRIDRKGLVAVWDSRIPAIPEKTLVCDACPICCSFGPSKAYILFVGTDDGCILTYDLREPGVHHQIVSLDTTRETVLRSPTYTTGFLTDGHSSPIASILPVNVDSRSSGGKQSMLKDLDRRNQSGLAFQLASLEEIAKLCIWIVVEILSEVEPDDDIGLAPYGKIKLIRSMNFEIKAPIKSKFPELPFRTTCLQFSVLDPNNFYVGTDTGHIVHCTQYEGISSDQSQGRNTSAGLLFFNEIEAVSTVTSIDINPFQLFGASLILAGYQDGSLRLYLSDRELPVVNWPFSTDGVAVVKVQWSFSRPSVFFVLDSSHNLHVWDLAIMHAGPIKTESSQTKPICLFALSNASPSHNPEIALAYEENTSNAKSMVEVHKLAPHFSQVTDADELDQLTLLLQSLL